MNIVENQPYYIDEFKTFNDFLKDFLFLIKDKKIKRFVTSGFLSCVQRDFSDKVYNTDTPNYLIFEDDIVLKFDYNFFSMIYITLSVKESLNKSEIEAINNGTNFKFDCYNTTINEYELNRFTDEYIIEPSSDTTRPEGGDYFKEIIFHLSNNKKICICAENAETDGYCDIWMENNNDKGIFNGDSHTI